MAKRPQTPRPPASEAAAKANPTGAGTEGALVSAPSGTGDPAPASAAPAGPEAAAATAAVSGAPVYDDGPIPESVIGEATIRATGLSPDEWHALPFEARQRLIAMGAEAAKLMQGVVRGIRDAARAYLDAGELVEVVARSRDGKPFRRAGQLLGDTYQTYLVTPGQARALQADIAGVQLKTGD